MSQSFYDPFNAIDENLDRKEIVPFWTVNIEDDEDALVWLKEMVEEYERQAEPRTREQRVNLAAYRGLHYRAQDTRRVENSTQIVNLSRNPRMAVNLLYEATEQHVSRLTKYRPAVAIDPADDDEYMDRVIAKTSQEVLEDGIWYRENIDAQLARMARRKRVFGEDFLAILWDKDAGDLHPSYKALQKKTGEECPRIPVLDDSGKEVLGHEGKPLYIDKPIRVGELKHQFIFSWDMLLHRKKNYERCEWGCFRVTHDVDEIKAEYPNMADKIEPTTSNRKFDADTLELEESKNSVDVYYFYHKGTRHLEQGRFIKFTMDVILENDINRYCLFGKACFPWVRWCDVDVPGILRGVSIYDQTRSIQNIINNQSSMILRNQIMCAHPKWMVPAGQVKIQSLGNDATVVQYHGARPPVLAQANPTPKEVFDYRDKLKEELFSLHGIYPTSRGEPPSGIKAFVALQFLDEQENERANTDVAAHNAVIREIALKDLAFSGIFYDDDPEAEFIRLKNLLGKKRATAVSKYWKMADLCRPYNIKIQNQSALPQQKAARVQFIFDYHERFPELMPSEQVVDLLDLGQVKKFQSIATVSIRAAEEENDELSNVGKTTSPEKYEDHLTHYRVHMQFLAEKSCKDDLPAKFKEAVKDHVMATEMLIFDNIQKNPMYGQAIAQQFPNFPVFFTPPPAPMPEALPPVGPEAQGPVAAPPQGAQLAGAAGLGAELPPGLGQEVAPGAGLEAPMESPESLLGQTEGMP